MDGSRIRKEKVAGIRVDGALANHDGDGDGDEIDTKQKVNERNNGCARAF